MPSSLAAPPRALVGSNGFGRSFPAAALLGVCAVSAVAPLAEDDGQILCPYRLATGGWCPGCGCTRALRALTHLDLGAAFVLNPWAVVLLAQAAVIAGWIAVAPERARAWWSRNDMSFLAANCGLGVAIWLTRLASGAVPAPF